MRRCVLLVALVVATLQIGCTITPDPEEIGPYPTRYKQIIKQEVLTTYYDPYSVRSVAITSPRRGHIFFQQGWIVCLKANAKNRMGGYVGLKKTAYLINRGEVVKTSVGASMCDSPKLNYTPWPELEQL